MLTSGLTAWIAEPANTVGAGASGVVFGYFGYIMVRGFFDRHPIDVMFAGIGENGHLAFNDPPADFTSTVAFKVVELCDLPMAASFAATGVRGAPPRLVGPRFGRETDGPDAD